MLSPRDPSSWSRPAASTAWGRLLRAGGGTSQLLTCLQAWGGLITREYMPLHPVVGIRDAPAWPFEIGSKYLDLPDFLRDRGKLDLMCQIS